MQRYYRIAIIAHAVFQAGDKNAETYLKLKAAGHGVELIDPSVVSGALDKEGQPDQALLRRFFETFRPDYVAWKGEEAQEILAACEQKGAGQAEPIRHVVVFGYVGPDNFGDELIFSLIASNVRKRLPGSYVSLIGHKPRATIQRHGVVSVTTRKKAEVNAMLGGATALVFMAGIMFDFAFEDYTAGPAELYLNPGSEIAGQAAYTLMAYQCDVPCYYLGIGAGPLANPDAQKLVKLASLTCPTYITRDDNTAQLLMGAGVDGKLVSVAADLAFTLEEPPMCDELPQWLRDAGLSEKSYIVAALREHRTCGEPLFEAMAALFDHAYQSLGLKTLFVDFAPEDHGIHEHIAALMQQSDAVVFFGGTRNTDLTLDVIAQAHATVAMRLHCSIIGRAYGVATLGINYNDKVEALYNQLDAANYLLQPNCTAQEAVRAFEGVLADKAAAARIDELVHVQRGKAQGAFERFFAEIEHKEDPTCSARLYTRGVSTEEQKLQKARLEKAELSRRLEKAEHELASARKKERAARKKLEDVKSSTTWKAGRMVTALPRRLKRISKKSV